MGIFDKAKELVDEHADKIDDAIGKAGDVVKDKTGGKYDDQVDKAEQFLKDQTGDAAK